MKAIPQPLQRSKGYILIAAVLSFIVLSISAKSGWASQKIAIDNPMNATPKIQIAILLDTSNSMDGLIDQTRNQLWQVVNEFSSAKRNGRTPILEVALFEYGNNDNAARNGFVRRLNGFTTELDAVSEGLFSLTTNGGDEYCGFAISTAVKDLQWSTNNNDIKAIFIAGNEPFTQGPVHFKEAISLAKKKGIAVNTIHAGPYDVGVQSGWQQGAQLAGGDYMSINADIKIVHIEAPQDKIIAELNIKLNTTYIPYGKNGRVNSERQYKQDKLNSDISAGLMAKRVKAKSSSFYNNATWDLVDALEKGQVNKEQLVKMDKDQLPEPMQSLPTAKRIDYVIEKTEERKRIKQQIISLNEQREVYVAKERSKQVETAPSMSDALTQSIKRQATTKDFVFEK